MVMFVLPNNRTDIYNAVKTLCLVHYSIPSQGITCNLLRKERALPGICGKVALQMACKVGAVPWACRIPLKDTMAVGYDSYHDTVNNNLSVGAVVSTTDPNFLRFTSSVKMHGKKEEIHMQIASCIEKALKE